MENPREPTDQPSQETPQEPSPKRPHPDYSDTYPPFNHPGFVHVPSSGHGPGPLQMLPLRPVTHMSNFSMTQSVPQKLNTKEEASRVRALLAGSLPLGPVGQLPYYSCDYRSEKNFASFMYQMKMFFWVNDIPAEKRTALFLLQLHPDVFQDVFRLGTAYVPEGTQIENMHISKLFELLEAKKFY